MALFSLNELNHFRVKLARNYTIVPFEFSKIIIDRKACLQALKLNVQLLHLLQFGITDRPECFRLKAAKLTCGSPTAMEQLQALLKSEASLTLILKIFFL